MNETLVVCKPNAHDFQPKRIDGASGGGHDIKELYCRKCGTVCFLTSQPESKIALARPS